MNIILVEGMDGAGKTTFIRTIKEVCNKAAVVHFTYEDVKKQPNAVERYANVLDKLANDGYDTVIFDRGWYSDLIYSIILRNTEDMSYSSIRAIERCCLGYGKLNIFFMSTTVEKAWKRCKERGEELIRDKETLKRIADKYAAEVRYAKEHSPATIYEVKT